MIAVIKQTKKFEGKEETTRFGQEVIYDNFLWSGKKWKPKENNCGHKRVITNTRARSPGCISKDTGKEKEIVWLSEWTVDEMRTC